MAPVTHSVAFAASAVGYAEVAFAASAVGSLEQTKKKKMDQVAFFDPHRLASTCHTCNFEEASLVRIPHLPVYLKMMDRKMMVHSQRAPKNEKTTR